VPSHQARFLAGAAELGRLPKLRLPQVAFAGRSNVGKSSLINRLLGRHSLARVSKTPGRTQQINFFEVDEKMIFVDLPGYGFARVPLAVKDSWKYLVEGYLTGECAPRCAVVIVDFRRGVQAEDRVLIEFLLSHSIRPIVAATKSDRVKQSERRGLGDSLLSQLGDSAPIVICSASSGEGIPNLWREIRQHSRG